MAMPAALLLLTRDGTATVPSTVASLPPSEVQFSLAVRADGTNTTQSGYTFQLSVTGRGRHKAKRPAGRPVLYT